MKIRLEKPVDYFLQSCWWQKHKNETGVKITAKNTLKIAAPKLFSSEATSQLKKITYENIKITRIRRKKKAEHFTCLEYVTYTNLAESNYYTVYMLNKLQILYIAS